MQPRAGRCPRTQRIDEVQPAVVLARLVDRDDVRVLDRRGQLRLALEALAEVRVGGELGGDQLQRDGAVRARSWVAR